MSEFFEVGAQTKSDSLISNRKIRCQNDTTDCVGRSEIDRKLVWQTWRRTEFRYSSPLTCLNTYWRSIWHVRSPLKALSNTQVTFTFF